MNPLQMKLDTGKIAYIVRAVLLYWLAIAGVGAVTYGVSKLSTQHQVDFGLTLVFVFFTGLIGWMAASAYKSKLEAKKWQTRLDERLKEPERKD